jgi:hypothetical protein
MSGLLLITFDKYVVFKGNDNKQDFCRGYQQFVAV